LISLRVIFNEIVAQKIRLILAIFSVAWGTASIAFMLSVGEGLRVSFMSQASAGGKITLSAQPGYTTKNYQGTPKNSQVFFTQENKKNFLKIAGVKDISSVNSFSATARNGRLVSYASPMATTPNYQQISSIEVASGGRFINYLDMREAKKVAFIGDQVSSTLFPGIENPVGLSFHLGSQVFQVIGISKTSLGFSSYGSSLSNQIIIPETTYMALSNNTVVSEYLFLLSKDADIDAIKNSVLRIIAKQQAFSIQDKDAIYFSDSQSSAKVLNTFLTGFQIFLGIVGGMTLLVSGVGIANIMYMSIKRATRIIGTQIAIGATYAMILSHYFLEALLITFTGGLIGVLATLSLVELLDVIPIQNQTYLELGSPKPLLSWSVLIVVIAVLGVTGFFAAFFPARNAARINPADALREE